MSLSVSRLHLLTISVFSQPASVLSTRNSSKPRDHYASVIRTLFSKCATKVVSPGVKTDNDPTGPALRKALTTSVTNLRMSVRLRSNIELQAYSALYEAVHTSTSLLIDVMREQ